MRATIKRGSRGDDVRALQDYLARLEDEDGKHYYTTEVDGIFGRGTERAVREFQDDYETLTVDGIAGEQTWGALEQAADGLDDPDTDDDTIEEQPVPAGGGELQCPDDVWAAFTNQFVPTITGLPVKYGPGRGLFVNGKMVVTYGPGSLGHTRWKGKGGVYPSFHCSSFTNFFLGWATRRCDLYTHRGNIPSLKNLLTEDNDVHHVGEKRAMTYRGYSPWCQRIAPKKKYLRAEELWEIRTQLPTFIVWGQSTMRKNGKWKWWHHTGMFVVDHRAAGTPMYRIAADGYKAKDGVYSGKPMVYREIDEDWCKSDRNKRIYRPFGVTGLETVSDRPLPEVAIEEL